MALRILVVGSGGREHALCWRIRRDRPEAELFCAPGNAGIAELATVVPIAADDIDGLLRWSIESRPSLVVIGPEDPLARGLVDALRRESIPAFGPTAAAARIESSKAWTAWLLSKHGVPAPESVTFDDAGLALDSVRDRPGPAVVKADGLAMGKGVTVCQSVAQAEDAIRACMVDREFGEAGARVVIQERLTGQELSVFAISDGVRHEIVGAARDYKRARDGDRGPNTGGMGSYTPVPDAPPELIDRISREIVGPTLQALRSEGVPYTGALYAGLMLTADGPKVFEFNCRFGDPEAQALLPTAKGDLVEAMSAAAAGELRPGSLAPGDRAAVAVVVASGGYPGGYETGFPIHGLDAVPDDVLVFHAGTERRGDECVTSGGRVLAVVGQGEAIEDARTAAYQAAGGIGFEHAFFRTDIAAAGLPVGAAA